MLVAPVKGKSLAGAVARLPPCLEKLNPAVIYCKIPVPNTVDKILNERSVSEAYAFVKKRKNAVMEAIFA